MQNSITANELKTKGISVLDSIIKDGNEVVINVRGKDKYVAMPIERYNFLRECELDAALEQAKADIKAGNYIEESVEDHINRITK